VDEQNLPNPCNGMLLATKRGAVLTHDMTQITLKTGCMKEASHRDTYIYIYIFFFIHLFTCAYIVWDDSPFTLPLSPPHFQAKPVLPFSPILLKSNVSNNKKDKGFLLVEIRTAVQRDS
jgi:hypothetical protein